MYCPNCGEKSLDDARFCGNCGKPLPTAEDPSWQQATVSTTGHRKVAIGRQDRLTGITSIVLIVLSFLPWVTLNLYVVNRSLSLPELLQTVANISSSVGDRIPDDMMVAVSAAAILFAAAWLFMVISLGYAAYRNLAKGNEEAIGYVATVVAALVVIVACFLLDASISQGSGSTFGVSISGIVTSTSWPWIAGVASIILLLVQSKRHFED